VRAAPGQAEDHAILPVDPVLDRVALIRERRAAPFERTNDVAAGTLDAVETNRIRVDVLDGQCPAIPDVEHRLDDVIQGR